VLRGRGYRQNKPVNVGKVRGARAAGSELVRDGETAPATPAGEVFTAAEPEAAGPAKYDETRLRRVMPI